MSKKMWAKLKVAGGFAPQNIIVKKKIQIQQA